MARAITTVIAIIVIVVALVAGLAIGYFISSRNVVSMTTTQTSTITDSYTNTVPQILPASLQGNFSDSTNFGCGNGFTSCSYTVKGAYANLGGEDANSVSITFNFYSSSGDTGQLLCSTVVTLGTVSAQTIAILPQATCDSSHTSPAQSWDWVFSG